MNQLKQYLNEKNPQFFCRRFQTSIAQVEITAEILVSLQQVGKKLAEQGCGLQKLGKRPIRLVAISPLRSSLWLGKPALRLDLLDEDGWLDTRECAINWPVDFAFQTMAADAAYFRQVLRNKPFRWLEDDLTDCMMEYREQVFPWLRMVLRKKLKVLFQDTAWQELEWEEIAFVTFGEFMGRQAVLSLLRKGELIG